MVEGIAKVNIKKRGKGEKKLHHLEIHMAENGGHIIKPYHHFPKAEENGMFGGVQEGEPAVFGSDEGHEAHKHIEKMTGMKMKPGTTNDASLDEGQGEHEAGEESEMEDRDMGGGEND